MRVIHILPHSLEPFCQPLSSPVDWQTVEHHVVTFITQLLSADSTIKHELWVVSNTLHRATQFTHAQGFIIRAFPRDFSLPLPLETSRQLLQAVKQTSQSGEPTIWHLHSYYLWMYDWLAILLWKYHQPFVAHFRGGGFTWRALPYSIYHYLLALPVTLRLADHIFAQNKREIQRLQHFYKLPARKITWLPNAAPIIAGTATMSPHRNDSSIRVIYVGRLLAYKGVLEIVRIVAELQKQGYNCTLDLVGEGPVLAELKQQYPHDWLHLHGQLSKQAVLKLLQRSDIFVLGTTKKEGSPQALIEAQGLGLPAVAFHIEGVEDVIVPNETGYLATTWPEFENYLRQLVSSSQIRQQFGQAATHRIKRSFAAPHLSQTVLNVYREQMLQSS